MGTVAVDGGVVPLLGVAVDQVGAPALAAVHAVLAGLGLIGLAAIGLHSSWHAWEASPS